jgi:hypothetical protein
VEELKWNLAERKGGIQLCVLKPKYLDVKIVDFFTLVKPEMSILSSQSSDFMAAVVCVV